MNGTPGFTHNNWPFKWDPVPSCHTRLPITALYTTGWMWKEIQQQQEHENVTEGSMGTRKRSLDPRRHHRPGWERVTGPGCRDDVSKHPQDKGDTTSPFFSPSNNPICTPTPTSWQLQNAPLSSHQKGYPTQWRRRFGFPPQLCKQTVNHLKRNIDVLCSCELTGLCVWQKGWWCCFNVWVWFKKKKRHMIINPQSKMKSDDFCKRLLNKMLGDFFLIIVFLCLFFTLNLLCVKRKKKQL